MNPGKGMPLGRTVRIWAASIPGEAINRSAREEKAAVSVDGTLLDTNWY
jgi:hypothetical protein